MKCQLLLLFALWGMTLLSGCSTSSTDPLAAPSPGTPPTPIYDNNGTQVSGF
jgi:hypothetical protein